MVWREPANCQPASQLPASQLPSHCQPACHPTASQPACQPACQPASLPASLPACQPASQPASQPTASQPTASRPTASDPSDHSTNCYFCAIDTRGYSTKNCHSIKYPTNLHSAFLPVPHSDDLPVPVFTSFHEDHEDVPTGTVTDDNDVNTQIDVSTSSDTESSSPSLQSSSMLPQKFNQEELSDLICDLEFSKQSSELLASRLGDKNMLEEETSVTFYRNWEKDFLKYFSEYNHGKSRKFVYCSDINGLLTEMGLPHYDPAEWRLFIDSSKRSQKCVLLHIGNDYTAVPIGHSTTMKEEYGAIKTAGWVHQIFMFSLFVGQP